MIRLNVGLGDLSLVIRSNFLPTEAIAAKIHEDSDQPRFGAFFVRGNGRRSARNSKECVLNEIVRLVIVLCHPKREPVEALVMKVEQEPDSLTRIGRFLGGDAGDGLDHAHCKGKRMGVRMCWFGPPDSPGLYCGQENDKMMETFE